MKASHILVMMALLLSLTCRAQHLWDSIIEIAPGSYTPEAIVKILSKKGITISYSQSALKTDKIKFSGQQATVEDILKRIFDLKKYDILEKENKILIVPKKEKSLRGLLGSLGNIHTKHKDPGFPLYCS